MMTEDGSVALLYFIKRQRLLITALLLFSSHLKAALVVDWGGDYANPGENRVELRNFNQLQDSSVDVDGDPTTMDTVAYFEFSLDDQLNPPLLGTCPNCTYVGVSDKFYGGAAAFLRSDDPQIKMREPRILVDHGYAGKPDPSFDAIAIRAGNSLNNPNGVALQHWAALLWKKEDFLKEDSLNDGDPTKVSFGPDANMMIHLTRRFFLEEGRFLVMEGEQIYASEFLFEGVECCFVDSLVFEVNPMTTNWAPYYPSGFNINFDDASDFQPRMFQDIQAVGFYFDQDELVHELIWWNVSDFEVFAQTSVVVPVPLAVWMAFPLLVGIPLTRSWPMWARLCSSSRYFASPFFSRRS